MAVRKYLWASLLLILLPVLLLESAAAASLPEDFRHALPPQAEELLEEVENGGVQALPEGAARIWETACRALDGIRSRCLRGAVLLLGVVLLCAVAEDCRQAAGEGAVSSLVPVAGTLAVTLIAAGDLQHMMGLGVETMEELDIFSKALLPALSAAVAAGGGAVSAGVRQVAALFFTELLLTLIRRVLLPLVYLYIAAVAADAMLPGHPLHAVGRAIARGTTWSLSGVLVVYTGFLSLSGSVAGSADALSVQLARSAMGAVPVVGGIISDAAGTVLAGAMTVRNTVGLLGLLAVLALCLLPVLQLAIQYLLYQLTAFLAGTVGDSTLVELIRELGGAFGMILGMTASCALLLLLSVTMSMTVVNGSCYG